MFHAHAVVTSRVVAEHRVFKKLVGWLFPKKETKLRIRSYTDNETGDMVVVDGTGRITKIDPYTASVTTSTGYATGGVINPCIIGITQGGSVAQAQDVKDIMEEKGYQLSIKEAKEMLSIDICNWKKDPKRERAVKFFLGETGNGKTQLIQQVAAEHQMKVLELNLGNALDPTELTGCNIPVKNEQGRMVLELAVLKDIDNFISNNEPFVLFIDELGAEAPQMRNFLLKLFAEDKLNGVLLERAYVVCAGNPPGKDYKTNKLETALRARVTQVYVQAKAKEVSDYFRFLGSKSSDMHSEFNLVADFLDNHPGNFGGSDGNKQDVDSPARCARSYHFAVTEIYNYRNHPKYLKLTLQGLLGRETGRMLADMAVNRESSLYPPEDILAGKIAPEHEPSRWKANTDNVLHYIADRYQNPTPTMLNNFIEFIKAGRPDDINGLKRAIIAKIYPLSEAVSAKIVAKMTQKGLGDSADIKV